MKWCLNQKVSTTPKVATNTTNYKYKTLALCVLQNPVTKCANTEAKAGN